MQNSTTSKKPHEHNDPDHNNSQLIEQEESCEKLTTVCDKDLHIQTSQDHTLFLKQKEEHENLTKVFINDLNGIILSILGNSELLKVKHSQNFNHEATNYLHKIEENSENLIKLLNSFHTTMYPDKKNLLDVTTAILPDSAISEA